MQQDVPDQTAWDSLLNDEIMGLGVAYEKDILANTRKVLQTFRTAVRTSTCVMQVK